LRKISQGNFFNRPLVFKAVAEAYFNGIDFHGVEITNLFSSMAGIFLMTQKNGPLPADQNNRMLPPEMPMDKTINSQSAPSHERRQAMPHAAWAVVRFSRTTAKVDTSSVTTCFTLSHDTYKNAAVPFWKNTIATPMRLLITPYRLQKRSTDFRLI
jgi:hypothetical protein